MRYEIWECAWICWIAKMHYLESCKASWDVRVCCMWVVYTDMRRNMQLAIRSTISQPQGRRNEEQSRAQAGRHGALSLQGYRFSASNVEGGNL